MLLDEKWIELASSGDHAGAVREFVRSHDQATFYELQRGLSGAMPTEGDLTISLPIPERGSVVLWSGVSREFTDAIEATRADGSVVALPTSPLTYLIDGATLNMPVAKNPPKGGYKSDRWVPCVLRLRERL